MASYEQRLIQIRQSLECVQAALVIDPFNQLLIEQEKQNMSDLEKCSTIEERILRKKSRATWIDYGESNSKYFYALLKIRASKNNITSVYNDMGMKITYPKVVENEFTDFFTQLMGKANGLMPCPNTSIIKAVNCLTLQHQQELIMDITHEEIDEAIRDMPKDKAPGVDGRMMPAWSCTAITLIPEVPAPSKVKDYRPIICCTTLYKVVAKILTRRIRRVIEVIIGKSQSVFIEGRSIIDNILFSHELFKGYNRKGQERISQGDPMSPYLFVIAMEYLQREMNQLPDTKANINSVTKMQETFQRFFAASGLQANADKSSMYIAGVHQDIKASLLNLIGYTEGSIPFTYLGVPLSAKKLNIHQCLPLVEKIIEIVSCWSARMLSYSERVQLIKSVLFGMQTYWAQIFILRRKIMKMIEIIYRIFLWTSSSATSRKALIAWDKVCQPKAAGGLNIINMRLWNKAPILKQLWALTNKKDALWIKWTHCYYIKQREVNTMDTPKTAAWVVRKIIEEKKDLLQGSTMQTSLNAALADMEKQGRFPIQRAYVQMQPQFSKFTIFGEKGIPSDSTKADMRQMGYEAGGQHQPGFVKTLFDEMESSSEPSEPSSSSGSAGFWPRPQAFSPP
uniref:Reverse transcriptase domain-containing protein n=1 Tax=Nicotiana tabacum TaxID=4097 RepID=A0A1S3XMF6_TOBAC|nr:PREDICTED: uncharacterized protein LOC107766791 [Nicotiana tabacum]